MSSTFLHNIVNVTVKDKNFDVTVLKMSTERLGNIEPREWFCAYVRLPELSDDMETFSCETFRNGQVVGIDTIHYHNKKMSIEQKYEDAILQITDVIESYLESVEEMEEE